MASNFTAYSPTLTRWKSPMETEMRKIFNPNEVLYIRKADHTSAWDSGKRWLINLVNLDTSSFTDLQNMWHRVTFSGCIIASSKLPLSTTLISDYPFLLTPCTLNGYISKKKLECPDHEMRELHHYVKDNSMRVLSKFDPLRNLLQCSDTLSVTKISITSDLETIWSKLCALDVTNPERYQTFRLSRLPIFWDFIPNPHLRLPKDLHSRYYPDQCVDLESNDSDDLEIESLINKLANSDLKENEASADELLDPLQLLKKSSNEKKDDNFSTPVETSLDIKKDQASITCSNENPNEEEEFIGDPNRAPWLYDGVTYYRDRPLYKSDDAISTVCNPNLHLGKMKRTTLHKYKYQPYYTVKTQRFLENKKLPATTANNDCEITENSYDEVD